MAKKTNFLLCGLSCLVLVVRTYNDPCASHPCPAKSYCVSKEQKYFCYCIDGYASNTGERNFKDRNVVCREIDIVNCSNFSSDATFQNCQKQLNLSSSMDNSREICTGFAKLSRGCGERRTTLSLQDIGNSYHFLTNLTSQITPGNQKQKARLVTTYLQSIEAAVLAAASRNPKETQKEEGPFMAINTQRVENCSLKTLSLKAEKQTMDIYCSTTEKEILGGIVAFISYASIGSIIGESFASEENLRTKEKLHNFYLNSKVVSGTVGSRKNISLPVSVNFTFQHEKMKRENEQSICVYWQGSSWSNEGCQVISSDENQTLCSCNHLSSFAILVATAKLKVLCSIIAGVLHYLYLASFTWMLLEGLQLFLTVKNLKVANYISAGKFKRRFIYPFGYGIPAVIVAVSAGLGHTSYGTETHCWLNFHGRFIWSFMGPVFVIILINFSFYLTTLCILKNQLSSLNNELSRMHNTRMLAFKAIAQLFILGCSWGLGFFLVEGVLDPIRSVMAYSFTIINVLQGVYIYLVYCLLNHKVREEYRRWFKKMRKRTETGNYDFFGSVTQTKTVENTVDFPGKSSNISS
ncbi:adhesion G protein-coupled receptor E3-like isoform X3 [Mustela lutreola]|uniref:adhesion G protein-coupled receptor E3-like isoform X3 n=1 Tax=Mustela lutreola TaxID=9666 RepID=UPI002796F64B|nr:adhesion G protein-coupled receptor E3-like isoform X3 [Mustela lutreola]